MIFHSKKFQAALAGLIVAVATEAFGLEIETEKLIAILSPLIAYIVGQGIADVGKEKAKVERE